MSPAQRRPSRLPIIIDTDVDIDDWMAILFLLGHPRVDVRGITVVGTGAAHLEPGTRNALDLLLLADRPKVPVAKGLAKPMRYSHQFPESLRLQVDNLYGVQLGPKYHNPNPPLPDALAFLRETLTRSRRKLSILAIGPLTNLGTLLRDEPELAQRIERIYVMGGAIEVPGNVHAADQSIDNFVSEWNVYLDPVAADHVFKSGVPVTLVPLDATRCAPVTESFYTRLLQNHDTPAASFIYEALGNDFAFLRSGNFDFWDPLAAAIATDGELGESIELKLKVVTANNDRSGQLLLDEKAKNSIQVYLKADGPAFDDLLLEMLNGEKTAKSEVTFILDGETTTLGDIDPSTLLIDYLHSQEVDKTGTKLACGEGGCGACTVMLTSWDAAQGKLLKRAINSCLRPVCTLDGTVVTTTEGIGSVKTALDATQHAIAANNGSQCGYCTPGFVMSMFSLRQNHPKPTEKQIDDNFDGHICRCTGYRPILAGFRTLAKDYTPPKDPPEIRIDPNYDAPIKPFSEYDPPSDFLPYMRNPQPLQISADGYQYYRPTSLAEVYALKQRHGADATNFKLLLGNTSIGIFKTRPVYAEDPLDPQVLVDVSAVPELAATRVDQEGLKIGGAVTLTRLSQMLEATIADHPRWKTRGLVALFDHLKIVACHQVRNIGSVAGNIAIGTNFGFLSDVVVVLAALGGEVTVSSPEGERRYPILDLPKTDELPRAALYRSIHIPWSERGEIVDSYKIRRRPENAHAIVNAAIRVRFHLDQDRRGRVAESHIVFNGVDADYRVDAALYGSTPFRPTRASRTEAVLRGKSWSERTLRRAIETLSEELDAFTPPDGSAGPLEIDEIPWSYRKALALNLFYKYYVHAAERIEPKVVEPIYRSAGQDPERPQSHGRQIYNSYPEELPVSLPLIKLSAFMQASGEAEYSHDVNQPPGTLEAAYVYSLVARGTFHYRLPVTTIHGAKGTRIDARQLAHFLHDWYADFVDYCAYPDLPNPSANWVGLGGDDPLFVPSEDDEVPAGILAEASEVFHPQEIMSIGAPLGIVVATDQQTARTIAAFVRTRCIAFHPLDAAVDFTAAIEQQRFFPQNPTTNATMTHIEKITRPGSNAAWLSGRDRAFKAAEIQTVETRQSHGFQNHFYLETMATLATPGENKTLTIQTSTQNLSDNQYVAANVLGISANNVRVVLRRDGGAFGGKQELSHFNSTAAALAAFKLDRPVRLVLDRNTNFVMCGERHPFRGDSRVAFDPEGRLHGFDLTLYSNGGQSYDVSFPVMDLAQMSSDNVYKVDTFRCTGEVCQTNLITNTAFRSFGTVQSINVVEAAIERVAHELGMLPEDVRETNFYRDGTYRWPGFEVTDQTLAVIETYGFDRATIRRLAKLKGQKYDSEPAFQKAVAAVEPEFASGENFIMLEEYSNTGYDFTPYLQGLKYCDIRRVWKNLRTSSRFDTRVRAVRRFNQRNRWKKRGISMIPLRYGVSYTGPRGTLNQGGAYVIAYSNDGSVVVQHGGVESGQGIQTKMAQIAAETLDIPLELIRIADTDTQVISDASPTAASTGSDLNGGAVQLACQKLRGRLEKFCEDLEQYTAYFIQFDDTTMDQEQKVQVNTVVNNWRDRWSQVWPTIISLAYTNRINLAAGARYKTPHYSAVDNAHPFGSPFFYYTYSAAVSEVEIDVLTGDFTILRTDILYDTGKSLNPLIDVGQIEGAFVQGVGDLTTEQLTFQGAREAPKKGYPDHCISSYGTWGYKPPDTKTIPLDFRVQLVDNEGRKLKHKGPRLDAAAVKSSKGIGEPPLVLANSVFYAIRGAVKAAREDQGKREWFEFAAPATVQRIQTACDVTPDQLRIQSTQTKGQAARKAS